jgi:hypothetical protein
MRSRLPTIYRKPKNWQRGTSKNYEFSVPTSDDTPIGDTNRASLQHNCAPNRPAGLMEPLLTLTSPNTTRCAQNFTQICYTNILKGETVVFTVGHSPCDIFSHLQLHVTKVKSFVENVFSFSLTSRTLADYKRSRGPCCLLLQNMEVALKKLNFILKFLVRMYQTTGRLKTACSSEHTDRRHSPSRHTQYPYVMIRIDRKGDNDKLHLTFMQSPSTEGDTQTLNITHDFHWLNEPKYCYIPDSSPTPDTSWATRNRSAKWEWPYEGNASKFKPRNMYLQLQLNLYISWISDRLNLKPKHICSVYRYLTSAHIHFPF